MEIIFPISQLTELEILITNCLSTFLCLALYNVEAAQQPITVTCPRSDWPHRLPGGECHQAGEECGGTCQARHGQAHIPRLCRRL